MIEDVSLSRGVQAASSACRASDHRRRADIKTTSRNSSIRPVQADRKRSSSKADEHQKTRQSRSRTRSSLRPVSGYV